ncbi:MAG: AMP-binding protein [Reyranellaceae bacterium]
MIEFTDLSQQTTPYILDHQARKRGDQPFLRMIGPQLRGGRSITYGEMELRTRKLANAFKALGIGHGDRVMILLRNSVEFVETWLALHRLAAVAVTVNTNYRGVFLEHVANNCAARFVVTAPEFVPTVIESEPQYRHLKSIVCTGAVPAAGGTGLALLSYEELRNGPQTGLDIPVVGTDIGTIIYTSGTTGPSKGVLIPQAQTYLNAAVTVEQSGLGRHDRFYSCLPLFHVNALAIQLMSAIVLGAPFALAEGFSASSWLDDVRESRATITNLLGVMTEFLVRQPETPHDADNDLEVVCAVPISPAFGRQFEQRYGAQLVELYGSTEANCPIYMPRDEPRRDNGCGRVIGKYFDCMIADPETGAEMPHGQVGEMLIRPKLPFGFMAGYNANPEATVKAWRNLWFHSGDAMWRDKDGWFYFVDRLNDCLRRRGENISSFEIEQVVMGHPAVADVAVIGVPSPFEEKEQEVKLCVVLTEGATASASDIHAFCAPLVPRYAIPRFVELYDALPKTPTNKVQKAELRKHGINERTWTAPAPERQRKPKSA